MQQYLDLIKKVLEEGVTKTDRTGTGTRSIFGYQTRFDLRQGFPLVTVKKTNFASIAHELLWFISGDTNIKYLVDNGVNIWNDWPLKYTNKVCERLAVEPYSPTLFALTIAGSEEFAAKYGDLGPIYGKQWRNFDGVDQLAQAVETIRTNPDSRRIIVSAWNPAELPAMALPPCHAFFQFICEPLSARQRFRMMPFPPTAGEAFQMGFKEETEQHEAFDKLNIPRHYVSLMLTQRSADIMLGVPFNIASYALLLEMVAKVTGTVAKELVYSLGDAHIYSNHLEQAEALLKAPQYPLPRLELGTDRYEDGTAKATRFDSIDAFKFEDIKLFNYQHGPYVKLPVAV